MDEFPYERRTRLKETDAQLDAEYENDDLHSHQQFPSIKGWETRETTSFMPQAQILGSHGKQCVRIKIKYNDSLPGPKVSSQCILFTLNCCNAAWYLVFELQLQLESKIYVSHILEHCQAETLM